MAEEQNNQNARRAWEQLAGEVLAVLYHDRARYEQARYDWELSKTHFPPGPWRVAFEALDRLYLTDRPIHLTHIIDEARGAITIEWLTPQIALYTPQLLGRVFEDSVRRLMRHGDWYAKAQALAEAQRRLRKATSPEEAGEAVSDALTALSRDLAGHIQDTTAPAALGRLQEYLQRPPVTRIPTGLRWLDNYVSGGIAPGEMWWIAAAYKRRKSSLMRNLVLSALDAGASVTVGVLEGNEQLLTAQLVVMLAVRWLFRHGHAQVLDRRGQPVHMISAVQLLSLGHRYREEFHPLTVQALDIAFAQFEQFGNRLRIYDRQARHGGLGTLESIQTMLRRDIARYGMQVAFLDYLQLISAGRQTEYENVSAVSRTLQQFAGEHQVALVVLAQLNEETVRGGGQSYSPGVKGGGDPAATADLLLTTGYPRKDNGQQEDTSRLEITIKLSRHGAQGLRHSVPLHPPSGLLLPD